MTIRKSEPVRWRISRRSLLGASAGTTTALALAGPSARFVGLAQDESSILIGTLGEADTMNPIHHVGLQHETSLAPAGCAPVCPRAAAAMRSYGRWMTSRRPPARRSLGGMRLVGRGGRRRRGAGS